MKVTKQTIEHVAKLSMLNLSEEEKERFTKEMEKIVSYVEKLNELDTSDVKPREHVIPMKNVFRQDKVKQSYDRDSMLGNAPSSENGCFRVPKVVE